MALRHKVHAINTMNSSPASYALALHTNIHSHHHHLASSRVWNDPIRPRPLEPRGPPEATPPEPPQHRNGQPDDAQSIQVSRSQLRKCMNNNNNDENDNNSDENDNNNDENDNNSDENNNNNDDNNSNNDDNNNNNDENNNNSIIKIA